MKEIFSSLDQVEISYVKAMLKERGIEVLVYDQNTSALYGDNFLFPKRLMVVDEDYFMANSVLKDLELQETSDG